MRFGSCDVINKYLNKWVMYKNDTLKVINVEVKTNTNGWDVMLELKKSGKEPPKKYYFPYKVLDERVHVL